MTDPTTIPPPRPRRKRKPGASWSVGDVADYYSVDPKTVTRWCKQGRLPWFKTIGGHHRIHDEVMQKIIAAEEDQK